MIEVEIKSWNQKIILERKASGSQVRSVFRNAYVVDVNFGDACITEQARCTDKVRRFVDRFDLPRVRFRFSAFPDFTTQADFVLFRRGGELHRVPGISSPLERNVRNEVRFDLTGPGAELQVLMLAHHVERVTLIDQTHVGKLDHGFVTGVGLGNGFDRLAAQIGLDRVVVHIPRAEPTLAARSLWNGGHFDHDQLRRRSRESYDDGEC